MPAAGRGAGLRVALRAELLVDVRRRERTQGIGE